MPPVVSACTFTYRNGRGCGKRPIVADYFTDDAVHGWRHVASLCAEHDGNQAQAYANANHLERREVQPWQ